MWSAPHVPILNYKRSRNGVCNMTEQRISGPGFLVVGDKASVCVYADRATAAPGKKHAMHAFCASNSGFSEFTQLTSHLADLHAELAARQHARGQHTAGDDNHFKGQEYVRLSDAATNARDAWRAAQVRQAADDVRQANLGSFGRRGTGAQVQPVR